jgi:hypothetical protein
MLQSILNNKFVQGCIVAVLTVSLLMWIGSGIKGSHTVSISVSHNDGNQILTTEYKVRFDNIDHFSKPVLDSIATRLIVDMIGASKGAR